MNIQPRYDISQTSMPLVVKLSNPTTAGDNRRGGSMCRRRWARGTVQGWAVKIVDPDAGCVVSTTNAHTWVDDPPFYPHSTCGSHLQLLHCVTLLLSLTNILFNLFIMLMWLSISCNKTSCVFTSSSFFFFSFFILFIFSHFYILESHAFLQQLSHLSCLCVRWEDSRRLLVFWCGRIEKFSWPLTLDGGGAWTLVKYFGFMEIYNVGWDKLGKSLFKRIIMLSGNANSNLSKFLS